MKFATHRFLLLAAALSIVTGCKVAVIVVEGGEVQSGASGNCLAGTVCVHEVTDTNYTESFTAVPDTGWSFVKWNNGGNFLCEDRLDLTCVISTVGLAGTPIETIIATDAAYYIQPVFVATGLPVPIVSPFDGNEWAQPTQFAGVSYEDIALACPGGVCSGLLNGYNMSGWTWATAEQVRVLLDGYSAGFCPTVPCSTGAFTGNNWVNIAAVDGFQGTSSSLPNINVTLEAYTSEPKLTAYAGLAHGGGLNCIGVEVSEINICTSNGDIPTSGGWFVR